MYSQRVEGAVINDNLEAFFFFNLSTPGPMGDQEYATMYPELFKYKNSN